MTLLEGYIALWNKYPKDEVKIRVARPHKLAPSQSLLWIYKRGDITWEQYDKIFRGEILSNPDAVAELERIAELSTERDVRLLCYEKNPPCHRFILLEMITHLPSMKGCHNCTWHEKDAHRCNDGDPFDCNWENDGTFKGSCKEQTE